MDYNETLNAMTLARLSYFNLASIMLLYREAGSATAVIENSANICIFSLARAINNAAHNSNF